MARSGREGGTERETVGRGGRGRAGSGGAGGERLRASAVTLGRDQHSRLSGARERSEPSRAPAPAAAAGCARPSPRRAPAWRRRPERPSAEPAAAPSSAAASFGRLAPRTPRPFKRTSRRSRALPRGFPRPRASPRSTSQQLRRPRAAGCRPPLKFAAPAAKLGHFGRFHSPPPPLLSASSSKSLWFLSTGVQHLGRSSLGRGLVRTPHLGEGSFLFPSEKYAFCKVSSEEEKRKSRRPAASPRHPRPGARSAHPGGLVGERARRLCRGPPGARSLLGEGAGSRGAEGSRGVEQVPAGAPGGLRAGRPRRCRESVLRPGTRERVPGVRRRPGSRGALTPRLGPPAPGSCPPPAAAGSLRDPGSRRARLSVKREARALAGARGGLLADCPVVSARPCPGGPPTAPAPPASLAG